MFNVIRDVDNRDLTTMDAYHVARIQALKARVKELEQQNALLEERNKVLVVTLAEVSIGSLISLHMEGLIP